MDLRTISEKVSQPIEIVQDEHIYYLCFNDNKNLMTLDNMTRFEKLMTDLENIPEGPACLVTFSSGKKFGTGFDLATFK